MTLTADEQALARLREYSGVPADVQGLYDRRADAIRQAYQAGVSISTISEVLGVGRKVVYQAIEKGER